MRMTGWIFLLALTVGGSRPGHAQDLKTTQKAIRERIMAEAGDANRIYTRVDFSDCAMTIQARTPKATNGEESRWTYSVHGTSLGEASGGSAPAGYHRVTVPVGGDTAAIRIVTQTISKGRIVELTNDATRLEFDFRRAGTAEALVRAFKQLRTICASRPFAGPQH